MSLTLLEESRGHLADLLEAGQRCAWYLQAGAAKMRWPLTDAELAQRSRDLEFYERLAAINERFGKLQDLLASTMRHLVSWDRNGPKVASAACRCRRTQGPPSRSDRSSCASLWQ